MADFTVGGTTYSVRRLKKRNQSVVVQERTFGDTLVSSRATANAVVPVWDVASGWLTEAECDTLIAALEAVGTVTLSGDLMPSSTVCLAMNIGWVSDGLTDDRSATFVAEKVDP
ncbi:MAG: hypothetical protein ACPGXI_16700 [Mycobacterium sp.]